MRRGSCDGITAAMHPHLRNFAQRRRSAPSLVLGKALGRTWIPIREEAPYLVAAEQCPFVLGLISENAELALDECVQLTEGLKTRERHLFLFSDKLVIAKLKANASYRLKHKVRLEELWLAAFEEEEGDISIDLKASLVMAWPLALCVVSFRCPDVKERWLEILHRKIKEAKERTSSWSPPPSVLMKVLSGSFVSKGLTRGGMDSLIELHLDGNVKHFPLSEKLYNAEDRSCPPIENGHNNKRGLFSRRTKKSSAQTHPSSQSKTALFGQTLANVCEENEKLPKPITEMLTLLLKRGCYTEGVFRRVGNSKNLKEIKEQLNDGVEVDMEAQHPVLLAALFKDFLRELPGNLLVTELYEAWMTALEKKDDHEKCTELRHMIDKLPRPNILLLQHLLCVLHHISKNADINKMDARNLAVCIAPNLFKLDVNTIKNVTYLTQFLIENCCEIFGEHVRTLLGSPGEEEQADNSDTLSSHQHDSAYDSTDPDIDGDTRELAGLTQTEDIDACHRLSCHTPPSSLCKNDCPVIPSCSSTAIFHTFTSAFPRRCSEPNISPSAGTLQGLARSQDDFSMEKEGFGELLLKKQNSNDSFLVSSPATKRVDEPSKDRSCSSICSLESSFSNQSENSVFSSSPLDSPLCSRKSSSAHKQSIAPRLGEEVPMQEVDVKRRSQSMRNEKKIPMRTKSWGNFVYNRGSLKKGDAHKENAFPCETLQEDVPSETDPADLPRRRPRSSIEIFQQVDSKFPGKPPSYDQAIQNCTHSIPPEYCTMTVQEAWMLKLKSRPSSLTEQLLYSCPVNTFKDCYPQTQGSSPEDNLATSHGSPLFRLRAMSESASRARHEVSRRCSHPPFEEMFYAKESRV